MNFYRCLICGDVYMGKEKPSYSAGREAFKKIKEKIWQR